MKRRAHYVLSSHWDREWYQTFQVYRYKLVDLLDHILEGIADGRLRGPFHTDGQSIMVEDYLEIRPHERPRIEQYVRERKLIIGPWYVAPDEFLVSGESLIRNLRMGRQIARSLGGEPSNAGFVCDLFGHISQLPQILRGFAIEGAMVWRGTNFTNLRNLIWEGADGSRLVCFRFGLHGYCGFANVVRHANQPQHKHDPVRIGEDIDAMLRHEAEMTKVDPLLIFDGGDHQGWDEQVYNVVAQRLEHSADNEFELIHSTLDDYLIELIGQSDRITTVWRGEMYEKANYPMDVDNQWLPSGVGSSRVWIKQANADCQTLLCAWAEPLAAFAHVALGRDEQQGFLDVAWRWLLQNHPHDSICGCSIDAVHEDMKYRFAQCRQIAEQLINESTRSIAAAVDGDISQDKLRVCVFNASSLPFDGIAELDLEIPLDWKGNLNHVIFEHQPIFHVEDHSNNDIQYQRLEQRLFRRKLRFQPNKFPDEYKAHEVKIALPLKIPAMGYTTCYVRQGDPVSPVHPGLQLGMATSERSMANEHLDVTIESNGTLTLIDLKNKMRYQRLLTFEDSADIGDGWYHGQPVSDAHVMSSACHADVVLLHDGPLLCSYNIRTVMRVPRSFDSDSGRRSSEWCELLVQSTITLKRDADYLEVHTTVHNQSDDHRFRVLFPTGAQAKTYLTDSIFDVVERSISLPDDRYLKREPALETKPQQTWTATHDSQRGLAVISGGLHEVAVRDLPERPIALTLFRATGRTVFTNGEPAGQLHGPLEFRYWIKPLTGEPDRAMLCGLGQKLAAGLRHAQLAKEDQHVKSLGRALEPEAGYCRLDGPAVVTSTRRVDGALEIRLFNPNDEPAKAILSFDQCPQRLRPSRASCVDFESNTIDAISISKHDDNFMISLAHKQIVTIRFS